MLTFGWAGDHAVDTAEETLLVGIADLAAVALATFRLASLVAERAEWYERVAHTDALTGLANDAHAAARPRAGGRAGRAPGQRGLGRRVRRRRASRSSTPRPGRGRATSCCARWRRSWPRPCAWWTPSAGPAPTSSCWSRPGVGRRHRRSAGACRASPSSSRWRATISTVSAGVARFPQDGTDGGGAARRGPRRAGGCRPTARSIGEATGEAATRLTHRGTAVSRGKPTTPRSRSPGRATGRRSSRTSAATAPASTACSGSPVASTIA